jgi:MoxR-like ATPase
VSDWQIYTKDQPPENRFKKQLEAPPWRRFQEMAENVGGLQVRRGQTYQPTEKEVEAVNAAIHLRRPLLLTGDPGSGKSSLAFSIAWRLKLGEVLYWPINSKTTLEEGLYRYDAIARLRDANLSKTDPEAKTRQHEQIERYLTLGPLGTALAPRNDAGDHRPRILLIDELDKSDIDLPNDLLHVFEEGFFEIPELKRLDREEALQIRTAHRSQTQDEVPVEDEKVPITKGKVPCREFPIVIITSNGEREFSRAFSRRCIRHRIDQIEKFDPLERIARSHFEGGDGKGICLDPERLKEVIDRFLEKRDDRETLANDQLLSALYLANSFDFDAKDDVIELILQNLQ